MPRIPSPVVVFLAAIAAAAPISACNSRPKVEAPDEAIVGEWKCPANGSAVTFSSSGLYSLTLKDQPRPVMGSFKFDPEEGMLTRAGRPPNAHVAIASDAPRLIAGVVDTLLTYS